MNHNTIIKVISNEACFEATMAEIYNGTGDLFINLEFTIAVRQALFELEKNVTQGENLRPYGIGGKFNGFSVQVCIK
ncbi:MAG: hypothetical protein R8M45_03670 [Ghiorsea sp.]